MNSRRKKVTAVLVLGSLVLAWRVVALIEKYGPSEAAATVAPATVTPVSFAPASDTGMQRLLERQAEAARLDWGRNPFSDVAWLVRQGANMAPVPDESAVVSAPQLTFTGTSRMEDQWLAAVQGGIHRVGDILIDGFTIVQITRHTLTLERHGQAFTYRLGDPVPKAGTVTEDSK